MICFGYHVLEISIVVDVRIVKISYEFLISELALPILCVKNEKRGTIFTSKRLEIEKRRQVA